ncbi:hypothetical protein BGZ72_006186 [Mortierella alpina]|nr:hypothetical protein BGZ72_006186 [Mortierella alpina]
MSPRPVRAAAKKSPARKRSSAGKDIKREPQSDDDFGDDQGDPAGEPDDNDDSDEYVAGSANGGNDDGDDDDDEGNMDMDIDDDNDNDKDDRKSTLMPKKSRRRRPAVKTYSVSLDEMNKLLTTHDDTTTSSAAEAVDFPAGSVVNTEGLTWKPVVRQSKAAPATAPKRANRPPAKKIFKKGFMHDSEMIPNVWKLSYQAPTSKELRYVSMQEDALRDTAYPNIRSSQKDFRVVSDPAELEEYLPVMATSTIYAREGQFDMPTMTAHYLETTTKTGVNDGYIFNTGFSVWALDWCPLPSFAEAPDRNMSYVAIGGLPDTAENCIDRDQLYPLGKQDAHPNIIQIWSMNCNTNEQGELRNDPRAYLALCILHSYGAVFDMKWCPTGSFKEAGSAPDELDRLGILAATFSDGTIRIFSVPEPGSVRAKLGRSSTGDVNPEPVYIEYPEPYATIRMGDICFMSVSWGTSERLAAGATNGTVPVWDMKAILNQTKETLAEKDSEYLDPVYLPQVHDVSVRSVDWFRNEDSQIVPWILVSSGYDGRVRYTDLHDIYGQIDVKTILGVPMVTTCVPWAEGCVYIDIDFGAKLDQLYVESRGFRMFNAQGTIWDLSYSDFQPFLAAAMSDGRVKISNPTYKAKRGYGMVQNHIYQLQEVHGGEPSSENEPGSDMNAAASSSHGTRETSAEKSAAFRYQEGEEKEYISKSAGFLSFYGANVAIQKVQWSRCYHSAAWLASGSAGGLVKVDNTMLRKEEGGEGNKIAYDPEPYVMKKRLAAGGQLPKIGRPKKIRDSEETGGSKRGKKTGGKKRKPLSKASYSRVGESEDEEEEAVESEQEDAEHEGDEAHVAGGDDDEFQDRGKTAGQTTAVVKDPAPRRTTRLQTGKIAPIFMRMGSNNRSQTPSNEDEDEGDNDHDDNRDEDEPRDDAAGKSSTVTKGSPRKSHARAQPAADAVKTTVPTAPKKPRGRPRKSIGVVGAEADASSDQTLLSTTKAMQSTSSVAAEETASASAGGDIEMTESSNTPQDGNDIAMEVVSGSTAAVSDKGKAKKAVSKAASVKLKTKARKGDPSTMSSVASPPPQLSAEATIAAVAAVVAAQDRSRSTNTVAAGAAGSVQMGAGGMIGGAEDGTEDRTEDGTEAAAAGDEPPRPISSLKASSVAPSSPRKTRGPSARTKKQLEEIKKQHRSLKEIWADGSAAKDGGRGQE